MMAYIATVARAVTAASVPHLLSLLAASDGTTLFGVPLLTAAVATAFPTAPAFAWYVASLRRFACHQAPGCGARPCTAKPKHCDSHVPQVCGGR